MFRRFFHYSKNFSSVQSSKLLNRYVVSSSISSLNLNHIISTRSSPGDLSKRHFWSSKEDDKKALETSDKKDKDKEGKKASEKEDEGEELTVRDILLSILFLIGIIVIVAIPESESDEELLEDESKCASKVAADKESGIIDGSNKIQRIQFSTRIPIENLTSHGIEHARLEGTLWDCKGTKKCWYRQKYWNDEAVYEMSVEAAEELRLATEELHAMCLEAVEAVVNSDDLLTLFEIPENMREEVRSSWRNKERDFLGRFDFMWDGRGAPKMAEYNADTPTILVETAVGQALWYDYVIGKGGGDNRWVFNELEEQLVSSWKALVPVGSKVHLAGILSSVEEREHIQYLRNMAKRAGLFPVISDVSSYEEIDGKLLALEEPLETLDEVKFLFKLYPWEWLSHEKLGTSLLKADRNIRVVEPAWKLILGNKAILALLWHLHPNHPNLLPAYFEGNIEAMAGKDFVAKPKFGREGQGIVYSRKCSSLPEFISLAERNLYVSADANGTSDAGNDAVYLGYPVYQEHCDIARFSGRHVVIGSWVVGGVPAGFNFREDSTDTTHDHSSFVPHLIKGVHRKDFGKLNGSRWTAEQRELYRDLYGVDVVPPADPAITSTSEEQKRSNSSGSGGSMFWRNWGSGSSNSSGSNTSNSNASQQKPNDHNTSSGHSGGGGGGGGGSSTGNGQQQPPPPSQPANTQSTPAKESNFKSAAERFRAKKPSLSFKGFKSTGASHKVVVRAGMGGKG